MSQMFRAAALILLVGCGPDLETACNDYLAAADACYDEAYSTAATGTGTGTGTGLGDACAVYDGLKGSAAKEAADLLACYADTISAGDCSTPEGYTETLSASTTDCAAAAL